MKLALVDSSWVAPLGPLQAEAGRAYRLCLGGRTARGERLLQGLATASASAEAKGVLRFLQGSALRLRGAMEEAAEALVRLPSGPAPLRALGTVLGVDAWIQAGRLEEARRWLEEEYPSLGTAAADVAAGAVRAALGQQEEAERLSAAAAPKVEGALADWLVCFQTQARLDAQRPAGDAARALRERLERAGTFDERFVRALWLEAQQAAVTAATAEAHAAALALLRDAEGYATNMPLYRHSARGLAALVRLAGGDEAAAAVAQAEAEALASLGLRFEAARLCTWLSLSRERRERERATPVVARARNLWHEMGAPSRAARLQAGGGVGASIAGTSLALSAVGGSIADVMLEEDVQLQAVFDLTREVTEARQVPQLLEKIVSAAVKVVKAERGALVRVLPEGRLECVAAVGVERAEVTEGGQAVSFGAIRQCLEAGAPLLTDNAMVDERLKARASVQASDLRSIACVPLKTPRALHGILYVDSSARSKLFTPVTRDLLGVFGAQAATALENAQAFEAIEELNTGLERKVEERTGELAAANQQLRASLDELTNTRLKLAEAQRDALEREMTLARGIQESLVPAPGLLDAGGVLLSGRLEQAGLCGGDFWTWGRLAAGKVFVLIGDVTGHGMPAALLTAVARSALDTVLPLGIATTATALLARLNDALFSSTKGKLQMTAWLGVFDLDARQLVYSNAGHTFPFYIDRSQGLAKLTALAATGPRLGESAGATFEEQRRAWAAGDELVLFTDGLTECASPEGTPWGDRALRRLLAELAAKDGAPDALVREVMAAAHAHYRDAPRADDVTVVVARVQGRKGAAS